MSRDEKINALSQYHQSLSPSHVSPFSLSLCLYLFRCLTYQSSNYSGGVFGVLKHP